MARYLFTSESVTEVHPDKVCDHISDAIVDACIEKDRHSRVAVGTLAAGAAVRGHDAASLRRQHRLQNAAFSAGR